MSAKTIKARAEPTGALKSLSAKPKPKPKPTPSTRSVAKASPTAVKVLPSLGTLLSASTASDVQPAAPTDVSAASRKHSAAGSPAPKARRAPAARQAVLASVPLSLPEHDPVAALPAKRSRARASVAAKGRSIAAEIGPALPNVSGVESQPPASHPVALLPEPDVRDAGMQASMASTTGDTAVAVPAGLKQLLALTVEEGLFLVAAASASLEPVQTFVRYEAEPFPRFINEPGYFNLQATRVGPVVYTAFVPWPGVCAGTLLLGCITASARKPLLTVHSTGLAELPPDERAALRSRFGQLLLPAALRVLPSGHALRLALQPDRLEAESTVSTPTAVRYHFDGVIDGLAHGWAFDPAEPGKALTIEVLHEGEVVARGPADRYREDLERIGFGDGRHHFRLNLSYELFDGQPHTLSVRVVGTDAVELSPPLTCTFEASQPLHLDPIPRAQTLAMAQALLTNAPQGESDAERSILQALRQCCLQQETLLLEQARSGYQQLIEACGANALCHCKIGETWLLDHQLTPALEAYTAALKLDPLLVWAHLGLGNVLQLQGQALQAREAYRVALSIDPGMRAAERRLAGVQADALVASAALRVQAGDMAGAIVQLRVAVFEHPEHEAACNHLDALLREPKLSLSIDAAVSTDATARAERARRLLEAMLDEVEGRTAAESGLRQDS